LLEFCESSLYVPDQMQAQGPAAAFGQDLKVAARLRGLGYAESGPLSGHRQIRRSHMSWALVLRLLSSNAAGQVLRAGDLPLGGGHDLLRRKSKFAL